MPQLAYKDVGKVQFVMGVHGMVRLHGAEKVLYNG